MPSNLASMPISLQRTPASRSHPGLRWLALISVAALCGPSLAQNVIGVGQTRILRGDTTFGGGAERLEMNGGELRIFAPDNGAPITVSARDAILRRGWINHQYAQSVVPIFSFFGTTSVTGGPVAPFPADDMYIEANRFDTGGVEVRNHGTFEQTGTGQITLRGRVLFVNQQSSTFAIDNDRGMTTFQFGAQEQAGFLNRSATLIKRAGTGTSVFDVPIRQETGQVSLVQGSLALNAGGTHDDSRFAADPQGTGHGGSIQFGGAHVFSGITRTTDGNFVVKEGASIRVANRTVGTPPIVLYGEWVQRGNVEVRGTINIDGSVITNFGSLTTRGSGAITGTQRPQERATFVNSGSFSGNIREGANLFTDTIQVINSGQFSILSGQSAVVNDFINNGGVLRVDGELSNFGGTLNLIGGRLQGTGIINGRVIVGGGPGVAQFNPGNSTGTMTITEDFSLLPGGELNLELQSIGGVFSFDRLALSGSVLLDGQVNILVGNGVQESDLLGLSFFDCGGACFIQYGNAFSWAFPGRTGAQLVFDTGGIRITSLGVPTAVPEPHVYAMMIAGLGLVAGWSRRRNQLRALTG